MTSNEEADTVPRPHEFGVSNWRFVRWAILLFGLFGSVSMALTDSGSVYEYLALGIPAGVALAAIMYLRLRTARHPK